MFAFALFRSAPLQIDLSLPYLGSLLYLSLFGSVVAFGSYLILLGRIGADRATYVTGLLPVVALPLSALFEHLNFNGLQLLGIALLLVGNFFVVRLRRPVRVNSS